MKNLVNIRSLTLLLITLAFLLVDLAYLLGSSGLIMAESTVLKARAPDESAAVPHDDDGDEQDEPDFNEIDFDVDVVETGGISAMRVRKTGTRRRRQVAIKGDCHLRPISSPSSHSSSQTTGP